MKNHMYSMIKGIPLLLKIFVRDIVVLVLGVLSI